MAHKPATVYALVRLNTKTGKTYDHGEELLTEREARQRVAWCGTDNLLWDRTTARTAADTLPLDGTPHTVGHYTFTATPTTEGA